MDKIQTIEKLFYYITVYSYLILPVSFLLILFFSKRRNEPATIIGIYGIICFISLILFEEIPIRSRKYYFTFYTFFEYAIFAYIIHNSISSQKIRLLIKLSYPVFFTFQIIYLFTAGNAMLDSIPIGVESILIFSFLFYYFYEFSKRIEANIIHNYTFWLTIGILVYLGGSFFYYIFYTHLNEKDGITFAIMANLAEIIKNLLFAFALFMYARYVGTPKKRQDAVPYLDMI